jgi:hypothetical protein
MSGDSVLNDPGAMSEIGGEALSPKGTNPAAGEQAAATLLEKVARPIAVAGMLTCIAISIGQFIRVIVPQWPTGVFAVLAFLVSLEAIYAQRLLKGRDLDSKDKLRFRFVEWVVILLIVRFAVYAEYGYARMLEDMAAWSLRIGALFDAGFIAHSLFMVLFWVLAGMLSNTMMELEASPIERMPAVTDPDHYLRSTMPHHGRVDRGALLGRITNIFWIGGMIMLILAGLSRVEFQELILFRHPRSTGVVLNVLAYFVIGLLIISQAQYTILKANWDLQDIPIVGHLGKRWVLLAVGFLLLIGLISALLPVHYSVGVLDVVGTVVRWIIYVVVQIVFLILFIISYGLGLLLSLFSGQQSPAQDTMPRTIAPPPPPAQAAADPNPWWAVIRSLVFWTILFGVIGYSFFHYARDRWGLFAGVSLGRFSTWLRSLWRRIRRDARRTRQAIQEQIRRRLAGRSRTQMRRRLFSLRRLSPRERVRYFYVSVLHRSERQGFGRGAGQTPFEYEQVLLRELPDAADEIHALTEHFIEARYTEHVVDEDREHQAQTVWQRIKKLLVSRRRRDSNSSPKD